MSGRNFGESGDFGSGENLLGIFGNGKFLLDEIIFARNIYFSDIINFLSFFHYCGLSCRLDFWGHLGGVRAWFVVQVVRLRRGELGGEFLFGYLADRPKGRFYFGFLLRG